jgi:nucleotide-binding universal stress UspA family protein
MFKHILIPTDGSELSKSAIEAGVAIAKAFGAKVTGLRTYPCYTISAYGEFGPNDDMVQRNYEASSQAEASSDLDAIANAAAAAGVAFEKVIAEQDQPWKTIVDEAQRRGCDLICMASHGRSGLSGVLLGSETNKVLTHTKVPVFVSR